MNLKTLVVGLGVQGKKRQIVAGTDCVATVDPVNPAADFRDISDVPLDSYDAALLCLPDAAKYSVIKHMLTYGKHVLVEKPLWVPAREQLLELASLAKINKLVLYTAYNHRFEPHIEAVRELLSQNVLGTIYRCRLFYGNGTAKLVRDSEWRDRGAGVLPDLCSHLLDFIDFWFDDRGGDYRCVDVQRHENRAPDHVVIFNTASQIKVELEMSLLSWRNHFRCDIIGRLGSLHIDSLCKWGPSQLIHRERVLPSGRPVEKITTLVSPDPTWKREYQHFKSLISKNTVLSLDKDIWLYDQLDHLNRSALEGSDLCLT